MNKLFRSLKAENIKLYSKLSSKLFIAVVLLLSILTAVCVQSVSQADSLPAFFSSGHARRITAKIDQGELWVSAGEAQLAQWIAKMDTLEQTIKSESGYEKFKAEKEYAQILADASVMRYRIDNDIRPDDSSGWDKAIFAFWMMALILAPLYLVCVSDIFAGEYSRGTVRTILPRPVTRIKQYIAKLITSVIYAVVMLSVALVSTVAACAAVCGGLGDSRYVGWFSGGILDCGRGTLMLMMLLCVIASYAIIAALCAALGNMTHSRAASAAGSYAVMAASWLLGEAICAKGSTLAAVSIFSVLDLSIPLMQIAHSAAFGFNTHAVCAAAYFLVFSFIGYTFFKKDV